MSTAGVNERTANSADTKAAQRRQWDQAAHSLRTWSIAFDRFVAPVTWAMVAHARIGRGAAVADVATGFGEPALTLAEVVGPTGEVVATDLSPGMLGVAAERARRRGLQNVRFVEMDAEEPTLPEARFDAVTCRLGLMFVPAVDVAVARLAALVAPDGRLVTAVWGPAPANPSIALAAKTLTAFLDRAPCPPGTGGLFDLGRPDVLATAFVDAGLDDVHEDRVAVDFVWPSVEAYVAYQRRGPLRSLTADQDPVREAAAWEAVAAAAASLSSRRRLHLPGEVVVVSGRPPPVFARAREATATSGGRYGVELAGLRERGGAGCREAVRVP